MSVVTTGTADVIVDDGTAMQSWEGFGGTFNEAEWSLIQMLSSADQNSALQLLFGTDGAHFTLGRIPIGANDYALSRYTDDETVGDTSMTDFSISRDQMYLIPYVQAALKINPNMRFWASPWTPPTWMKTNIGNATTNGPSCARVGSTAFDGGCMQAGTNNANLSALILYFTKWIQAYGALDPKIVIDTLAPQTEPNFANGYPSALWSPALYTQFVDMLSNDATFKNLGVKIMLGTLSNGDNGTMSLDVLVAKAVLGDTLAKTAVQMVGLQWGMLDIYEGNYGSVPSWLGLPAGLDVWATTHKAGNYPFNPTGINAATGLPYPPYTEPAPNDLAYGNETWGDIRKAIQAGVTTYSAWHMVLDGYGKSIDTTRSWSQDSLLVVGTTEACNGTAISTQLCATPAYYAFRHVSQFVAPGAHVVAATGNDDDVIAFKNPDGSIITVLHNAGTVAKTMIVKISGSNTLLEVPGVPANGWATVKYVP